MKKAGLIFCTLLLIAVTGNGQDTIGFWDRSPQPDRTRISGVAIGLGATYAVSMAGLYTIWYKDYAHSGFHTFDDNNEWLQVDKAGHFGSAYYLTNWGTDLFYWTGLPQKKSAWLGAASSMAFLTTIEIFDGYSAEWGFSTGDMIANVTGAAASLTQTLLWQDQRIRVKFSFHPTDYNQYNPDLLGDDFPATLFKDYNGQTYWLSANINAFLSSQSKFPKWINLAVGYGAEGMTSAGNDPSSSELPNTQEFKRYRQFYLAPDIELTKIKTNNKTLKALFNVFGFVKFPAPTLEVNGNHDVVFHWLYF